MVAQFRCVDAAVIRVAVFGSQLDLPAWPDLTGDTPEHVQEWRSWLARVREREALGRWHRGIGAELVREVRNGR